MYIGIHTAQRQSNTNVHWYSYGAAPTKSAHVWLIGLKACRKQIEARSGQVTDFGIPDREGAPPWGGVKKTIPLAKKKAATKRPG